MTETEYKLLNWRGDSLNAERMCADILIMQDFESVDPQSPLGGPDETKDILCKNSGRTYLAAVYFAPLPKTFRSIKNKFLGDYKGVKKNNVDGVIFMTNQKLTPGNKKVLQSIGEKDKVSCIIYDNEAIRGLLDSSLGLPIRLLHLKIKLSKADQISFFTKQQNKLPQLFETYSKGIISVLTAKIDKCCDVKPIEKSKIGDNYVFAQQTIAFIQKTNEKSDKKRFEFPKDIEVSIQNLSVESLKYIHKAIMFESGSKEIGIFRNHMIWIGSPDSPPEKASFIPPKPELVPKLTNKLLEDWKIDYPIISIAKRKTTIIQRITKFHNDFLAIHPFLDGNGRVARFLLNQQVNELLKISEQIIIEDKPSYYEALNEGQNSNLKPLEKIITIAIYGTDIVE
ncbi:MAG: Fic family protein [Flavobacterium sp.]|uniref:Fic family protein n=1 Tax=Flavobacterium sp. TaxID=239 RepID=UPI003BE6EDDB